MSTRTTETSLVRAAEHMDTADFVRHMNRRHADSLEGWRLPGRHFSPYVEMCFRIFHRRLHQIRVDLEHEHDID
jgi:hypothetical protein